MIDPFNGDPILLHGALSNKTQVAEFGASRAELQYIASYMPMTGVARFRRDSRNISTARAMTLSIAHAIQNNPLIGFGRVASAPRAKLWNGGFWKIDPRRRLARG